MNNATAESVLVEINSKLEILYQMQKKIDDLTETVDFYTEKYQKILEFKESAEKKIIALENKNVHLQKVNSALEDRIAKLELAEVERVVEIAGLETTKGENVSATVGSIAECLKLSPNDIEEVKRVGREKEGENRPRPVVVLLRSKKAKQEWMNKKKTVKTNESILKLNNNKRVYINEGTTKPLRQLLWNTKVMLKDKFKYIWIQNHCVLVKENEESKKIYNIRCDFDIKKLISEGRKEAE